MSLDKQDWEDSSSPKTEKEKKQLAVGRIERDLAGANRSTKKKTYSFAPPTEAEKERMKNCDMYGNPYKTK